MSNKAKQKGTTFETQIVNFLHSKGFNEAYRPALKGGNDTGDINGIKSPHRQAIVQAKNQKRFTLSEWLDETVAQGGLLGDALPILVVKRPRVGEKNLGDTYAVLRLEDVLSLMQQAGYE